MPKWKLGSGCSRGRSPLCWRTLLPGRRATTRCSRCWFHNRNRILICTSKGVGPCIRRVAVGRLGCLASRPLSRPRSSRLTLVVAIGLEVVSSQSTRGLRPSSLLSLLGEQIIVMAMLKLARISRAAERLSPLFRSVQLNERRQTAQ